MTKQGKSWAIIHTASASAAGVGAAMAQAPGLDIPVLEGIEITMVISLGGVYGINLTESAAKSILASTIGTVVGRGITQALFGWIPVAGNVLNACTATGVVESLGFAIYKDFEKQYRRGSSVA